MLSERYESALEVYCVNDDDVFVFIPSETKTIALEVKSSKKLFVPNASVMKAGCFPEIETRFGIRKNGKTSHLFIGSEDIVGFAGRVFNILCVTTM